MLAEACKGEGIYVTPEQFSDLLADEDKEDIRKGLLSHEDLETVAKDLQRKLADLTT